VRDRFEEESGMWHTVWKRIEREMVVAPLRLLRSPRRIPVERWLRGREEAWKLARADAVIVSFGKSGRTWLRVLLSRYWQLKCGLPQSAMIRFDNFHRRDPRAPKLLFTHDNYLRDYTGHRDDKRDYYDSRVVLLARDPRDVAVSQFFQWKFRMRPGKKDLNAYPPHEAEVSIFDFVTGPAGVRRVVEFLNGWARELDRIRALHLVRYEDMRADTAGELGRVLRFLGEEPTPEQLADCAAFASVENMRRLEEKRVFWLSGSRLVPKDRGNPDSYKVRRAKVGGWRDYFEDGEIAVIDALVADLDPVFGYRPQGAPVAMPQAAAG
jgi:hypothetical protein